MPVLIEVRPLTGEPCAGDPPAWFGGRGGASQCGVPTPIRVCVLFYRFPKMMENSCARACPWSRKNLQRTCYDCMSRLLHCHSFHPAPAKYSCGAFEPESGPNAKGRPPCRGEPPTGEPDAGSPLVRFGGKGGAIQCAVPTLSDWINKR